MKTYILSVVCSDQKGLIFRITEQLFKRDLNIVSNGEYVDDIGNRFFMRTEFSGDFDTEALKADLQSFLPTDAKVHLSEKTKKNILVFVTKESHCLGDILMRVYADDFNANIQAVVGNHSNLKTLTETFKVPFHHIGHENKSRQEHEQELMNVVAKYQPDYIVLAKYMRILSPEFIDAFPNKIINIHHSFLPAFVGARPYEQAFNRGVKIIGATAHYVTKDLDEGPIIAQNTISVSHNYTASDMAKTGRDVEKIVLSQALQLVLDERVFINGNKTVILD